MSHFVATRLEIKLDKALETSKIPVSTKVTKAVQAVVLTIESSLWHFDKRNFTFVFWNN